MSMKKLRLYAAGLMAFLLGMPLTAKLFAQDNTVGGTVGNLIDMATGETMEGS